jgi:hypothetical protein
MLPINSARPTPSKNMAKWFRLANSFEGVSHRVFEKTIETFECRLIAGLPMAVVLPTQRGKD